MTHDIVGRKLLVGLSAMLFAFDFTAVAVAQNASLEEVVVTAQRRAESLEKTD